MQQQDITRLRIYLILCSRNEKKSLKDNAENNCYLSAVVFPLVLLELGNPGR